MSSKGSRMSLRLASSRKRRFALLQLLGGNRRHPVGLLVGVLEDGEAEGDLAALYGDSGCLGDGLVDPAPPGGVYRVRALLLAEADGQHLRRPALDGAAEGGVGLYPVYNDHRVRLEGVLVHVDGDPSGRLPDLLGLHRRPDGAPDALLAHPEVPQDVRLALGRRGPVAPHSRDYEGLGSGLFEEPYERRDHVGDPAYPAAPNPHGDRPGGKLDGAQRLPDRRPDVLQRRRAVHALLDERYSGRLDVAEQLLDLLVDRPLRLHAITPG